MVSKAVVCPNAYAVMVLFPRLLTKRLSFESTATLYGELIPLVSVVLGVLEPFA